MLKFVDWYILLNRYGGGKATVSCKQLITKDQWVFNTIKHYCTELTGCADHGPPVHSREYTTLNSVALNLLYHLKL